MQQQAPAIDPAYLVQTMVRLMSEPTEVPLGSATLMEPDSPKLVHYVQDVVRPLFVQLGAHNLIDAGRNNLVVQMGTNQTDRSLLLMVYTVTQHHNLMENPFPGRIANGAPWGFDEPCFIGQGVSQNKAHLAVLLAVVHLLQRGNVDLRGRLYLGINNEGRSSHECSQRILQALPTLPEAAVLLTKTDMAIQLGNRGRVDAIVTVRGKATHSSRPHLGLSAIDGANEVINRIKAMKFTGQHPILGGQHAVVYQVTYAPMAPHTLPESARLMVDRRLLPGDDPEQAVDEIRRALGDMAPYEVTVEPGTCMLPALVDADSEVASRLASAFETISGRPARTMYAQGTFDAGGPCAAGVPAVMFGASGGDWPLGIDLVPISTVVQEAQTIARLVLDWLG